jgi:hypothetical protein
MRTPRVATFARTVALLLVCSFPLSAGASTQPDADQVPGTVRVLALLANEYGANTFLNWNNLELLGWEITSAGMTSSVKPCSLYARSLGCPNLRPDLVISGPIDVASFDVLVVMPSTSYAPRPLRDLLSSAHVLDALAEANSLGLVLAAQCAGARLLGEADVIAGKQMITSDRFRDFVVNAGAEYLGPVRPPVTDQNLVTTVKGLYYSVEYVEAIAALVQRKVYPPASGDVLTDAPFDLTIADLPATEDGLLVSTLGGNGADGARGVCAAPDGGMYIAGYSYSAGAGASDALVIKLSAFGLVEWAKTLGGVSRDEANAVVATQDGGCLIVGLTTSVGEGGQDVLAARFGGDGTLQWARSYGSAGTEVGMAVCPAHGAGFIIAGHAQARTGTASNVLVLKIDDSGGAAWEHTFGGGEPDRGHDAIPTRDGGYLIVGNTGFGPPDRQFHLIKTDSAGNLNWESTTGNEVFDSANAAVELLSGGFIAIGHSDLLRSELMQLTLVGVDAAGQILWRQDYGRSNFYDYGTDISALSDNRFVVAGATNATRTGQNEAWLHIIDGQGATVQSFTYGEAGSEWLSGVCALGEGGFAAVGHTNSIGAGSFDVLLIRAPLVE